MYLRMTVVFIFVLALASIGAKGCEVGVIPSDTSDNDDNIGPVFGGSCDDLSGVDFGACEMFMGWAVVDGSCQPISGCDAKGYTFFEAQEHCQSECLNLPKPDTCDDGSVVMCKIAEPHCGEFEILGILDGCYACVNPDTCKPWGEAGCKDDSECGPDERCDPCGTASCPYCGSCLAACVQDFRQPGCETDADCQLLEDYCGGCNCLAVPIYVKVATCPEEEQVQCFAAPCHMYETAVCSEDGQCIPE